MFPYSTEAQCSLCKAARDSGGWSTKGLNTGILYLMSIPYIAFTVIAFFWYKSSKKYSQQQKKIAEALKGKISND